MRLPDGSHARHCYQHGGKQERLPPGHPERGGRPPSTFAYCEVLPDDAKPVYEAAHGQLGKLDHEIALARTNLYRFQQKYEGKETGGIAVHIGRSGGGGVTIRAYADIVGEYLDRIGRLEERRARIIATIGGGGGDDGGTEEYAAWVRRTRSSSHAPSGSTEDVE